MKTGSSSQKLLTALLVGGGVFLISLTNPAGGGNLVCKAIAAYIKNRKLVRARMMRDLKNLQSRKLVRVAFLKNGIVKVVLTKNGKKRALKHKIIEMKLKPQAKWDGRWRLVMFDIPHKHREARDALRSKLRDLKFHQMQKSVYITPHPCEEEIDFISSVFDVGQYVIMMCAQRFIGEEKLIKLFNLTRR